MEFPLENCPQCSTRDLMIKETDHLFVCPLCFSLFSVFPYNLSGDIFLRVTHYMSGVSRRVNVPASWTEEDLR
jgi:hypothetical protein